MPDGRLNAYLMAFEQDMKGEVYILSSETSGPSGDTGKVYKIVSVGNLKYKKGMLFR